MRIERRTVAVAVLAVLVGLAGAFLAVRLIAIETTELGPFTVESRATFGAGETVVELPPLGEVRLDTHDAPISVRSTLVGVDVERLTSDLGNGSTSEIARAVEEDARSRVAPFALRVFFSAIIGGAIAGALAFRTRWRRAAVSMIAATALVGSCLFVSWRTFDPQAFAEPTFEGSLRFAPQLLGNAKEMGERLDAFRANLERIVGGAITAYSALGPQEIGGRDELRVLHISDVHLNTVGIDFAVALARGFDVDLVIDTGDLTSYGTPLEEEIAPQLERFGRPYVFVRGNHDPPEVADAVDEVDGARVLDGDVTRVEDLRIFGAAHPVFTEDRSGQPDEADNPSIAEGATAFAPTLKATVDELDATPDVVAVHDDRMSVELAGEVPLVLSGHFHRAKATSMDGTLFLRAGSTGGAGVNMFEGATPIPLSANVLYFDRESKELVAYDLVQQLPASGRLVIQRHLTDDMAEATPPPSPDAT